MVSVMFAAAVIAAQAPSAPPGQVAPQIEKCLHGTGETAAEKARREEAIAAMRMIDWTLADGLKIVSPGSAWPVTDERKVSQLRAAEGAAGELARKLKWDAPEPLPGWRLSWKYGQPLVVFSLIDTTDPCGFRVDSSDERVIPNTARVRKAG